MSDISSDFGDELHDLVTVFWQALNGLRDFAQLSNYAYVHMSNAISESKDTEFEIQIPIRLSSEGAPQFAPKIFAKDDLLLSYQHLSHYQLSIFGVYQMVTVIEAMLLHLARIILLKFPKKMGGPKNIPIKSVIEEESIESLHKTIADHILHEIFFGSPLRIAKSLADLIDVDIAKCGSFLKYCEVKATRDVYVHNGGMANKKYEEKAGNLKRALNGQPLPLDQQYLLESLETCVKFTDELTRLLHEIWPSKKIERHMEDMKVHNEMTARALEDSERESPTTK